MRQGPTVALVLAVAGCGGKDTEPGIDENFGVVEEKGTDGCDNLLPTCLYPYPSSVYVDEEGRVRVPATPFSGSSLTLDPEPLSANRGFGAASPILFQLPGAIAPTSWAPFDPAPSMSPDAVVVLVDAATGERIPHWVESDYLSPLLDPPLILVRPSVPLPRGTEIVVGVRHLTGPDGVEAPPSEAFAALRDGTASHWKGVHDRRETFEQVVFPALEAAGVPRGELQLAWSFPTQSDADATSSLVAVRDTVFAALPPEGPAYTLDAVTLCDGGTDNGCDPHLRVIVDGTVTIPSVVEPADALGVRRIRRGSDGRPVVEGAETWPFRLQLPNAAFDGPGPVPVVQYGHGFLGSSGEADGGWLREMADRLGFAILACDMMGMNEDIAPVWLTVLGGEGGRFPELQELPMQGVVNQLVEQRLVRTTLAADAEPALYRTDGALAWDPDRIYYFGNSQGGSVGTLVVATSLDVERGVLGVPGSGYPLLLDRSTVFSPFASLLTLAYPGPDAISVFLALLGTGWDQSDPLTFAPHLHGAPLLGTPDHDVLYHVAKEDQQVINEASFISARSAGAVLLVPAVRPVWGLDEVPYPDTSGAALVEVDFGVPDDPTPLDPPDGDPSMVDDGDTHGWLRKWPPAQDQLFHFLETGEVVDVCGGAPCLGTPPE